MRPRLTRILLLTAWLMATGSHWDLMQVFAWSRMLIHNAEVLPVREALEFTFTPRGMCTLCHIVQDGKRENADAHSLATATPVKAPLVFQALARIVVTSPSTDSWSDSFAPPGIREQDAPDPPPPRSRAVV